MADIDLERKNRSGMGWLWWALGLLALILLAWWLWPDGDDDDFADMEADPVESVGPAATPQPSDMAGASIGDILANPDEFIGETFPDTEVTVAEVPTDRGFWIESEGQRLFAIVIDQPQEQQVDINPGQTLRIEDGTLRDQSYLPDISGDPLDADTEELAEQQDIFLVVDERYITVVEGGEPQPGTDPAQGVQPNQ